VVDDACRTDGAGTHTSNALDGVDASEWGTREFGFRDSDGNGLIVFRDR
jgi:hypothetical protein